VVDSIPNGPQILYIDKHLIHEVTSPQAFNELKRRNIPVFRPKQIVATADHNTPTVDQHLPVKDELSRNQLWYWNKSSSTSLCQSVTVIDKTEKDAHYRQWKSWSKCIAKRCHLIHYFSIGNG